MCFGEMVVPCKHRIIVTLFVSLDQQNQQPFSSVFLSQQTSEQYFQPQ
jgi:hypothetical protein